MDPVELADTLQALDADAFAAVLQMVCTHDDAPAQAKKLIIDSLRFAAQHGFSEASAPRQC